MKYTEVMSMRTSYLLALECVALLRIKAQLKMRNKEYAARYYWEKRNALIIEECI